MAIYIKHQGQQKKVSSLSIKENGNWHNVLQVYIKRNGSWERVFYISPTSSNSLIDILMNLVWPQ